MFLILTLLLYCKSEDVKLTTRILSCCAGRPQRTFQQRYPKPRRQCLRCVNCSRVDSSCSQTHVARSVSSSTSSPARCRVQTDHPRPIHLWHSLTCARNKSYSCLVTAHKQWLWLCYWKLKWRNLAQTISRAATSEYPRTQGHHGRRKQLFGTS